MKVSQIAKPAFRPSSPARIEYGERLPLPPLSNRTSKVSWGRYISRCHHQPERGEAEPLPSRLRPSLPRDRQRKVHQSGERACLLLSRRKPCGLPVGLPAASKATSCLYARATFLRREGEV